MSGCKGTNVLASFNSWSYHGQGKLDFNQSQGNVRAFFLKVVVNYFISCLHVRTDKGSLSSLIVCGQNNHPAQSVKIAFQSGKNPEFFFSIRNFMLPTGK